MKFGILCTLLSASLYVSGQQQLNRDPQNIVDPTGFMRVLAPPVQVEGSANMFDAWQQGDLYISEGKLAPGITFNYDIMNHMLSVLFEGKEYSLNPVAVDSIQIIGKSQSLVNPVTIEHQTSDLLLLKIYDSENLGLYRKTKVEIIKPTYNEILNVGNRNYQIDQDYSYLLRDHTTGTFTELTGKKKELKMMNSGDKLLSYVKEQNIDLKNEADLMQVIQYYEQLVY